MAGLVPYVTETASALGANAVAVLEPEQYERKLAGLSISGPAKSTFALYIGQIAPSGRADFTPKGDSNSADYASPFVIPRSSTVYAVWPGQAASAGQCLVTFRLTS